MADRDAVQDERIHELFRALREGVVRVPGDFSRRVGEVLGGLSVGSDAEQPGWSTVVGKLVVETFNILGYPLRARGTAASERGEAGDDRRDRE